MTAQFEIEAGKTKATDRRHSRGGQNRTQMGFWKRARAPKRNDTEAVGKLRNRAHDCLVRNKALVQIRSPKKAHHKHWQSIRAVTSQREAENCAKPFRQTPKADRAV